MFSEQFLDRATFGSTPDFTAGQPPTDPYRSLK